MKAIRVFRPLLVCLMLGVTLLSSCKKNDKEPEPDRNKFLGNYSLEETCSGNPDDYNISVTAGTETNEITIKDLYFPGIMAKATVSGNSVTIPSQDFGGHYQGEPVTITLSGSGTLSDSKLSISYKTTITGLGSDDCTAVCIKR